MLALLCFMFTYRLRTLTEKKFDRKLKKQFGEIDKHAHKREYKGENKGEFKEKSGLYIKLRKRQLKPPKSFDGLTLAMFRQEKEFDKQKIFKSEREKQKLQSLIKKSLSEK